MQSHLRERSNIAANRLILNKDISDPNYKGYQTARYLEDQYSELYKSFQFSSELSFSTFYKYANITGEYKKPKRLTDLCDYCEKGKDLKKKIDEYLIDLDFETNNNFDIKKIIEYFMLKRNDLNDKIANQILKMKIWFNR